MTDEQVKKELEEIVLTMNWGGVERVGGVPKPVAVAKDTLALINRLEEENARLENKLAKVLCSVNLDTYHKSQTAEQIRKETAKEILQDIEYGIANTPYYRFNPMITREIESIVSHIQKKWNVEVEQ